MRKPVVLMGSSVDKIYEFFYRDRGIQGSKENAERFAFEIRLKLDFLFRQYAGSVIPNENASYPQPFDYAFVTVATDELVFRFFRGREELRSWVASKRDLTCWGELDILLARFGWRE